MPSFLGDVEHFITTLLNTLEKDGIPVSHLELDHICYRVETKEEYADYQTKLSQIGTLLTEAEINGRPISTYKLTNPIQVIDREIYVVELPSPKESQPYQRGLEHAEFVIKESFEVFMQQHPNITFNTNGISKLHNPDIAINYETFTVKFHHASLEKVIENE